MTARSTLFLTRGDFSRVHSTQSFARFVYSRDLDLVSVRCPYVLKTSVKQSRTLNDGSLALGTRMDWSHPALPSLGRRAWAVTSQLIDVIPKPVLSVCFSLVKAAERLGKVRKHDSENYGMKWKHGSEN